MSPRVSKKDRGELPKSRVQEETVGFYPLTTLGLGLLYEGQVDAVLGFRDDPTTLATKEHSKVMVKQGNDLEAAIIKGSLFNGISDAFFRGKLPHVVLVAMDVAALDQFIEEFLDHLDKLLSLGFFLKKANPVEELVPCFVMASQGIFFARMVQRLSTSIGKMNAMDPVMTRHIVGKFVRGAADVFDNFLYEPGMAITPVQLKKIRIAGGTLQTQLTVQSVFGQHGLVTSIENASSNSVERLELTFSATRLVYGVIPALAIQERLTPEEVSDVAQHVKAAVLTMGQKRHSFDETETLDMVMGSGPAQKEPIILPSDRQMVATLANMADHYHLSDASRLFDRLKSKITGV